MINVKIAVLLIVASVLVPAVTGIAVAQYTNDQANTNGYTQERAAEAYSVPLQGYPPYGASQYGNGDGYSGMGMCGRLW
jgi:hypothetical protein